MGVRRNGPRARCLRDGPRLPRFSRLHDLNLSGAFVVIRVGANFKFRRLYSHAIGFGIHITLKKLLFGIRVEGWAMLMVSIWFLSGIIISSLSVVGLYVSKIFIEVKNRPYSIVRRIHRQETTES